VWLAAGCSMWGVPRCAPVAVSRAALCACTRSHTAALRPMPSTATARLWRRCLWASLRCRWARRRCCAREATSHSWAGAHRWEGGRDRHGPERHMPGGHSRTRVRL
jgi:hypothetical protein